MRVRYSRAWRRAVVRAAYRFHRQEGARAADALQLARAEAWAQITGADAYDVERWDDCQWVEKGAPGEMVSDVTAGFVNQRTLASEHVPHAPSVSYTVSQVTSDRARRSVHAEALWTLRTQCDTLAAARRHRCRVTIVERAS